MQLALTPEVLFPLGACAVVAAAVIAVVVVLVRSGDATADDALPPTSADWTGEAATADPVLAERPALPALPPRLTVAEAVAVREADTAPLPVTSAAYVQEPVTAPPVTAESVDPDEAQQAGPVPPVAGTASDPDTADADAGRDTGPATAAGSGPAVATAVAHVLAARAAAHRAVEPVVPSRTADARDRLLAVLLADPVRAVGAAEELATCRGQLGDVLARLAASGLTLDQLARLSGFSTEQVATLLARQNV